MLFCVRYKSFSRSSDNIGDITAKGEAQLAVVDLFGMLTGIILSTIINSIGLNIKIIFIILFSFEMFCNYKEVQR
jgi:hypothetical protein